MRSENQKGKNQDKLSQKQSNKQESTFSNKILIFKFYQIISTPTCTQTYPLYIHFYWTLGCFGHTDQQSDSDCFAATRAKTKSVSDSAKRETSLCMNQVLDAERSELVCEILWRNS